MIVLSVMINNIYALVDRVLTTTDIYCDGKFKFMYANKITDMPVSNRIHYWSRNCDIDTKRLATKNRFQICFV